MNTRSPTRVGTLDGKVETLGELLQRVNYDTAMFSPLAMAVLGLGQGFAQVVDRPSSFSDYAFPVAGQAAPYGIPPADKLNAKIIPWLERARATPFFTWIHYYDAHRPFAVFTQDRPFVSEADRGKRFGDSSNDDYQLDRQEREARGIGAADAQYLIDRYDSGLLDLDRKLGVLLDALRASSKLDETIVVITADHGEAFAEFDEEWFTHDPFLFDAVTHVPLLIRFPKGEFGGIVRDQLVQSIDVMPTLLDYLDRDFPDVLQGVSLRDVIERDVDVNDYVASERRGRSHEKREGGDKVELPPEVVGARRSLRWRNAHPVVEAHGDQVRLYSTDAAARTSESVRPFDPQSRSGQSQLRAFRDQFDAIDSIRPDTVRDDHPAVPRCPESPIRLEWPHHDSGRRVRRS